MLDQIDLSRKLPKAEYERVFPPLQERLRALQRQCKEAAVATVVVFEGWDAAGKGSLINLLLQRLDPRGFKVHPISAPNVEEQYRPFLWRFWLKLPAYGEMAVFDRSWYGRVLVERVDELVAKDEWRRAYQEICEFERTLADDGQVIVKFLLHISKDTQRERFKACEKDPTRRWKIHEEDWQHHRQYRTYHRAYEQMLAQTHAPGAPWHVVAATDHRWAEVEVFKILIAALEARLELEKVKEKVVAKAPAARKRSAGARKPSATRGRTRA